MIKCSDPKCGEWFFYSCVALSNEIKRSTKRWKCYKHSTLNILLPKWGGTTITNTCPLDNFLASLIAFNVRYPAFKKWILQSELDSDFKNALKEFISDKTIFESIDGLQRAKDTFMRKVYGERKNLWGTESSVVFDHLLKTEHAATFTVKCDFCKEKTTTGAQEILDLSKSIMENEKPFAEKISSLLRLKSHPNQRCQSCNRYSTKVTAKYITNEPFLLRISYLRPEELEAIGLIKLEEVPLSVKVEKATYELGAITISSPGHFISLIPTESGYIFYDGMDDHHPVLPITEAIELCHRKKGTFSSLIYYRKP